VKQLTIFCSSDLSDTVRDMAARPLSDVGCRALPAHHGLGSRSRVLTPFQPA
jgi:hypothetical protein